MARFLVWMRATVHAQTVEHRSEHTFRRRVVPTSPAPRLVAAARRYKKMGWLPSTLITSAKLPRDARLPLRYVLPYYGLGKAGWTWYRKREIDADLRWDPASDWNNMFPVPTSAWGSPTDDASFAQLRLQGPNPFTLKRAEPDVSLGDHPDAIVFDLDFSRLFANVFEPTVARFEVQDADFFATRISIGNRVVRPQDDGWDTAKRVVNGLDARYTAFIRHLLNTHLMVGEAYAVAAYTLPIWHPLRPFMDFFTYGTLRVNEIAYGSLLTETSYFIRSNFITPEAAYHLITNATNEFDFDEWLAPHDITKRGIDQIPGHPYVDDARKIWPLLVGIVDEHLADLDIVGTADVVDDPHLVAWYATLCEVLPGAESIPKLRGVDDLRNLMVALLYNNVIHEVAGDFSPITNARTPADRLGVNLTHLQALADPDAEQPQPLAREVLLVDQASFVSRFNVKGNNLLTIDANRYIDDPRLARSVIGLQHALGDLDTELAEVNRARAIPFEAMRPYKWEASISY